MQIYPNNNFVFVNSKTNKTQKHNPLSRYYGSSINDKYDKERFNTIFGFM